MIAISCKLQEWLFRVGLVVSSTLLIRLAIDFGRGMRWWLSAPLDLLVIATLSISAVSVFGSRSANHAGAQDSRYRGWLLAAIPISFLASSLGCNGLNWSGCSPFCTFVKLVWAPLIAVACIVYYFSGSRVWLTAILASGFLPLIPHCTCYNVCNGWWINWLGASPLCYSWAFSVTLISSATLDRARGYWWSLAVSFTIIGGAMTFFVSHHYFHFPW